MTKKLSKEEIKTIQEMITEGWENLNERARSEILLRLWNDYDKELSNPNISPLEITHLMSNALDDMKRDGYYKYASPKMEKNK